MLNKTVFKNNFERLVNFFPTWGVKCEESSVMKEWYEKFNYMSDKDFEKMVNKYIDNEMFNPTVAGLKKHYTKTSETKITRRDDY